MTSRLSASNVDGVFPTPLHEVSDPRTRAASVRLHLKRDDLVCAAVPGNKYRKLKYNMATALADGYPQVLAFGGAYSNLLRATAVHGEAVGLPTIGVVRGEEHDPPNQSLQYCVDHGMKLVHVTRDEYRKKAKPEFLGQLADRFGEFYLLPEGASNALAVRGCAELVDELDIDFSHIACSVGTGGTMAGIVLGLDGRSQAIGFSSLKGGTFLADDVRALLQAVGKQELSNWRIETGFHFGGYARRKPELNAFRDWFERTHSVKLDWVYEAKMLFGVYDLIESGAIPSRSTVVAVEVRALPAALSSRWR